MAGRHKHESESSCASCESHPEKPTPANDVVLNKYIEAGKIAQQVMQEIIPKIVAEASVAQLCIDGDKRMLELTANYRKSDTKLKRGIAQPVSISVNNVVCGYAPLPSDQDSILEDGDMAKIELGVHIDGFIGTCAHTVVVGASKDNKVTGPKADVMTAAYNGMELAIRMLRAGQFKSTEVSAKIDDLALIYQVKPIENTVFHQMEQDVMDLEMNKYVVLNLSEQQKFQLRKSEVEAYDFEPYEVYAVNIFMSTGDGKARTHTGLTTMYRRLEDAVYNLKMKASRIFYSEITQKHGTFVFNIRDCEDENKTKMGVVECVRHGLLKAYPVCAGDDQAYVAQFKSTVIIQPNGLLKTCAVPLDTEVVDSKVEINNPEIKKILMSSLKPKKKGVHKAGAPAAEPEV
ncbi:hypothetical protein QR680_009670 [Steinernema hermaphroditum]|uniref:Peptidase M24 domain-containing protein n=1 Tax=Steinernema hermaphroditum TaxID=289476 RepID=A0AA39MAB9_9BILA|nr:hypothetical protein QR680_009670 [Steinernema hermaphroditum]